VAWAFFGIGAAVVTAIAFAALGLIVGRLEGERSPAVYQLDEGVDWIVERLPGEVTSRLSYDDVRQVLLWHLDWFEEVGVSSPYGTELAGDGVISEGAVADSEAAVDAVVARCIETAATAGGGIEPVDVVCVLELQMRYLAHIGAVGSAAE